MQTHLTTSSPAPRVNYALPLAEAKCAKGERKRSPRSRAPHRWEGGRVVQKGNRGRRGRSSGRWASASAPLNGPAGTLAPRLVTSAAAERPISGARESVFSGAPGRAAVRSEHPRACAAWMRPAAAAAALAFLAFNKRCIIVGRHLRQRTYSTVALADLTLLFK